VFVTSSVGSWIADQFGARWPSEVAGLVLNDPSTLTSWPDVVEKHDKLIDGGAEGCIRWSWSDCFAELAQAVPTLLPRCIVVSSSNGRWTRNPPPPPYQWWHPLTLPEVDQLWQGFQRDWVRRLGATHIIADTAGHFVHIDQPDLVAHSVVAVSTAARAKRQLQLHQEQVAAAGGRLASLGPAATP
jgi:pimeloyl-ACP methyl ester carboxylesterase